MKKLLFFALMTIGFLTLQTSCSKDEDDTNNNTPTCTDGIQNGTETGVDCGGSCSACVLTGNYFQALINGATFQTNSYNGFADGGVFGPTGTTYNAKNGGVWTNSSFDEIVVIYIIKTFATSSLPSVSQIDGMFHTGSYNFGENDYPNFTDGAYIEWKDEANGKVWTTNGNQSGSTFQITSRTSNNGSGYITIEGSFSCKLYDSSGNQITATNGTFKTKASLNP